MKASICMASYNRAPAVLKRVLESIFVQKPPFDFEVIVCDDGSPDQSTQQVCQQYSVQYYRIDRPPGRRNPCVARNVAYRQAQGDVIIAQSDEVVHIGNRTIETLIGELESQPGSFVLATVYACGPDSRPWSTYTGLERRVPYFFLGALWRRDLYAVGGNDEVFRDNPGYDDEWFAQCLMNGLGLKPVYLISAVGHHLYHPPSMTRGQALINRRIGERRRQECEASGQWCATGGPWPWNGGLPGQAEREFTRAYANQTWGNGQSCSGEGSSEKATVSIRACLPAVWKTYGVRSVLDLPCGDFCWMKLVDLNGIQYIGADLVASLVEHNRKAYGLDFRHLDLLSSELPQADLVLCRDCLGHLSLADSLQALDNIRQSGSRYLMATTFPNHPYNRDIKTGAGWTTRCMTSAPFSFPPPRLTIDEMCRESFPKFADKSLSLWQLDQ